MCLLIRKIRPIADHPVILLLRRTAIASHGRHVENAAPRYGLDDDDAAATLAKRLRPDDFGGAQ
jgi:hypothetical protein